MNIREDLEIKISYNGNTLTLPSAPKEYQDLIKVVTRYLSIEEEIVQYGFQYKDMEGDFVSVTNEHDYNEALAHYKTFNASELILSIKENDLKSFFDFELLSNAELTKSVYDIEDNKKSPVNSLKVNIKETKEVKYAESCTQNDAEPVFEKGMSTDSVIKSNQETNTDFIDPKCVNLKNSETNTEENFFAKANNIKNQVKNEVNNLIKDVQSKKIEEKVKKIISTLSKKVIDKFSKPKDSKEAEKIKECKDKKKKTDQTKIDKLSEVSSTKAVKSKKPEAAKPKLTELENLKKECNRKLKASIKKRMELISKEIYRKAVVESDKLIEERYKKIMEEKKLLKAQLSCSEPLSEVQSKIIHEGVTCDGCEKIIVGIRYKCSICNNFDLCHECEEKSSSEHTHPFIKIRDPKLAPLKIMSIVPEDYNTDLPSIKELIKNINQYDINQVAQVNCTKSNSKQETKNLKNKEAKEAKKAKIAEIAKEDKPECTFEATEYFLKLVHGEAYKQVVRVINSGKSEWNNPTQFYCLKNSTIVGPPVKLNYCLKASEKIDVEIAIIANEVGNFTSLWQLSDSLGNVFGEVVKFVVEVSPKIEQSSIQEFQNNDEIASYQVLAKQIREVYDLGALPEEKLMKALFLAKGDFNKALEYVFESN